MNACTLAFQSLTDRDLLEALKLGVSVLTLISIVIAYLSYRANLKKLNDDRIRERDKELLAQAGKSLQWAFDVLTNASANMCPDPDRLNWLTCARHLLRGRKIAVQISSPTYRIVYEEIEEYWRHRFYIVLSHDRLRSWTYYADETNPNWPEKIEISSALVIVDFSTWKKDAPDPLNDIDRQDLIRSSGGIKGGNASLGLEGYLEHLEKIKAQHNATQPRRVDQA